jgi:5-deoxy-glucuronate isomerase
MDSMQTQLKFNYVPKPGLQQVVSPDNSDLKYISLHVLRQDSTDSPYKSNSGGWELALVILSGTVDVIAGDFQWKRIGGRSDVFAQRSTTVYVPSGTDYQITAVKGTAEIAIGGAISDHAAMPALITPEMIRYEQRGIQNWERHIYDAITTVNPVSQRLFIIEVITPPGNWSSVPPHKHDRDNPPHESSAEEIYFYKMQPETGFGFQRVYTDDRSLDEALVVEHNSAVIQPRGYHPVANHPGYWMYYLNIIAGERRGLIPYDDPAHAWVRNMEAEIKQGK